MNQMIIEDDENPKGAENFAMGKKEIRNAVFLAKKDVEQKNARYDKLIREQAEQANDAVVKIRDEMKIDKSWGGNIYDFAISVMPDAFGNAERFIKKSDSIEKMISNLKKTTYAKKFRFDWQFERESDYFSDNELYCLTIFYLSIKKMVEPVKYSVENDQLIANPEGTLSIYSFTTTPFADIELEKYSFYSSSNAVSPSISRIRDRFIDPNFDRFYQPSNQQQLVNGELFVVDRPTEAISFRHQGKNYIAFNLGSDKKSPVCFLASDLKVAPTETYPEFRVKIDAIQSVRTVVMKNGQGTSFILGSAPETDQVTMGDQTYRVVDITAKPTTLLTSSVQFGERIRGNITFHFAANSRQVLKEWKFWSTLPIGNQLINFDNIFSFDLFGVIGSIWDFQNPDLIADLRHLHTLRPFFNVYKLAFIHLRSLTKYLNDVDARKISVKQAKSVMNKSAKVLYDIRLLTKLNDHGSNIITILKKRCSNDIKEFLNLPLDTIIQSCEVLAWGIFRNMSINESWRFLLGVGKKIDSTLIIKHQEQITDKFEAHIKKIASLTEVKRDLNISVIVSWLNMNQDELTQESDDLADNRPDEDKDEMMKLWMEKRVDLLLQMKNISDDLLYLNSLIESGFDVVSDDTDLSLLSDQTIKFILSQQQQQQVQQIAPLKKKKKLKLTGSKKKVYDIAHHRKSTAALDTDEIDAALDSALDRKKEMMRRSARLQKKQLR